MPPAGVPDGTFMRQIHQIWCIIEAMAYCGVLVLFWHIFIKFTQKCKTLAFFIWCQFRVKFFDSRGNLIFPTFSHVGGRGGGILSCKWCQGISLTLLPLSSLPTTMLKCPNWEIYDCPISGFCNSSGSGSWSTHSWRAGSMSRGTHSWSLGCGTYVPGGLDH